MFTLDAGNSNLKTTVAGGNCTFSLSGSSSVTAGDQNALVNMQLQNNAPAGGPVITSITLAPPSGSGITLVNPADGVVPVNLGGGQSTTIGVYVKTSPSCGTSGPFTWLSSVTPANFTGSNTAATTINAGTCSMSITAPSSAAVGQAALVTVGLTGGPLNVPVTLTPTGCPAPVTAPLIATAVAGVASFNLTFTVAGSCSLTATATAANYPPAGPKSLPVFAIPAVGCSGLVGSPGNDGTVDPNLPSVANPNTSSGQWGLRRGNNSDGTGCDAVNATFTLDTTNKVATLTYDKAAGGPAGVFKYTIVWPEVAVDPVTMATASWTDFRPKVSWGIDSPVLNSNDYVPALTCVDDLLSLGEGLLPFIPNVGPFISSPYPQFRPFDGSSQPQKARMCIAQHAWTSNQTLGGVIQVIYWDKVVDEGDGHVGGP